MEIFFKHSHFITFFDVKSISLEKDIKTFSFKIIGVSNMNHIFYLTVKNFTKTGVLSAAQFGHKCKKAAKSKMI